jgi:CRP-like cAMP-binding protein
MDLPPDRDVPKRFWCVDNFSLADVLTEEERAELHKHMQFVHYKAGETIYFPGDPSRTVYSIRDGCVRLAYLGEQGHRLTFAIIGRGQVFGEMALAGEQKRGWIAEAMEDSVLCIISKSDLLGFAERNPKLALRINKMLGDRLLEIENKLEDVLFRGVNARLSRTLLKLAEQYGEQEADGVRIRFRLTHQELAHLIGAARETTSAALGDLERRGLIRKGRGAILLRDLERLRQVR